jgi:DNA-binding Lrp family transcriptional regulator
MSGPGPGTRPRGRPSRAAVNEFDLWLMTRLEGRAPLKARELAQILGVSQSYAWHLTCALRRRGVAKVVAAVRPLTGDVEVLAYLDGAWDHAEWPGALEAKLRSDPCVADAVQITGRSDVRVRAFHADAAAADAWFRDLLATPGVQDGRMQFTRTLFERPCYAAALLSGSKP